MDNVVKDKTLNDTLKDDHPRVHKTERSNETDNIEANATKDVDHA